jgi:hypothetical protein
MHPPPPSQAPSSKSQECRIDCSISMIAQDQIFKHISSYTKLPSFSQTFANMYFDTMTTFRLCAADTQTIHQTHKPGTLLITTSPDLTNQTLRLMKNPCHNTWCTGCSMYIQRRKIHPEIQTSWIHKLLVNTHHIYITIPQHTNIVLLSYFKKDLFHISQDQNGNPEVTKTSINQTLFLLSYNNYNTSY